VCDLNYLNVVLNYLNIRLLVQLPFLLGNIHSMVVSEIPEVFVDEIIIVTIIIKKRFYY